MGKKSAKGRLPIGDKRILGGLVLLLLATLIVCVSCASRGTEGDGANVQTDAAHLSETDGDDAAETAEPATPAPLPELEPKSPLQVNVRVFVPGTDVLPGFVGHYDVEIIGSVQFRGKTFTDPVFSYGANRSQDGIGNLEIFDAADTADVYAVGEYAPCYFGCTLYQWHFEIDDEDRLDDFLSAMDEIIATSVQHPYAKNGLMCTIVSDNTFSRYQRSRTNCFYAAALWMFRLGDPTLLGILRASESGWLEDVLPATIVAEYAYYLEPISMQ